MTASEDNCEMDYISENPEHNVENGQAIQILLFPPKDKKFRVDEETNYIHLEPLKSINEPEHNENKTLYDIQRLPEPEDMCDSENIPDTPAVENIAESEITEIHNNSEECLDVNVKILVEEVLKIGSPFKSKTCFMKGCKWSPDGLCLLSNSEDNVLRLFEIPECTTDMNSTDIMPVLMAKEGGTIYDYEWYPKMNSSDPVSCVFASTSQNSPIHLWDAYTGCLRATYQPINQYDEVTAAYSLAFSPDGNKIYCGFKKCLRIFDIALPGRKSLERKLKSEENSVFQTNIISCIAVNPIMHSIYVLGSYDRTLGIYTEPEGELQCIMKGHHGGITQVMFSPDGIRLYSGARKDSEIICWDLRKPGEILFILNRAVNTNQRIYFDLTKEGSYLVTGSTDHKIIIYDTKQLKMINDLYLKSAFEWKAHNDCVNGVQFHPFRSILASSSGQHHISQLEDEEDESNTDADTHNIENSLKIWSLDFEKRKELETMGRITESEK